LGAASKDRGGDRILDYLRDVGINAPADIATEEKLAWREEEVAMREKSAKNLVAKKELSRGEVRKAGMALGRRSRLT
jgi:hypothetical protein